MKITTKSQLLNWTQKSSKFESYNILSDFTNYSTGLSGIAFQNCVEELYKGGVNLHQPHLNTQQQSDYCQQVIQQSNHHIFYQVTFCTSKGLSFRADIVVKNTKGQLKIIEAKDSSYLRYYHILDVGIQQLVLQSMGISNNCKIFLAMPNPNYVNQGKLDLIDYIDELDVTVRSRCCVPLIEELLYKKSIDTNYDSKTQENFEQFTRKAFEINPNHFSELPYVIELFNGNEVIIESTINETEITDSALELSILTETERMRMVKKFNNSDINFLNFVTHHVSPPLPGYKPVDQVFLSASLIHYSRKDHKITRYLVNPSSNEDPKILGIQLLKTLIEEKSQIIVYGTSVSQFIESYKNDFSPEEVELLSKQVVNLQANFFDYEIQYKKEKWETRQKKLIETALTKISNYFIPEINGIPKYYNWTKLDYANIWPTLNGELSFVALTDKKMFEFSSLLGALRITLLYLRMEKAILQTQAEKERRYNESIKFRLLSKK